MIPLVVLATAYIHSKRSQDSSSDSESSTSSVYQKTLLPKSEPTSLKALPGPRKIGISKEELAIDILSKSPIKKVNRLLRHQVKTHAHPTRIVVRNRIWCCQFTESHKGHLTMRRFKKLTPYPIVAWMVSEKNVPYLILAKP